MKTFEDIRKRKHRHSRLSKEPHNQFHLRFQEKLAVFLVARPLELPFQFRTLLDPSPQPLQGTFLTSLRKIQARQLTFPVSLQAETLPFLPRKQLPVPFSIACSSLFRFILVTYKFTQFRSDTQVFPPVFPVFFPLRNIKSHMKIKTLPPAGDRAMKTTLQPAPR